MPGRRWTFGDGTSSTTRNPSKEHGAAGTYSMRLTVTGGDAVTLRWESSLDGLFGTKSVEFTDGLSVGAYEIRLIASDGVLESTDSIRITIQQAVAGFP